MLATSKMVGFVGVRDAERAKAFYRDTLGLKLVLEELPFALVFDCDGTALRVTLVREVAAAPYTVLGWAVTDITATASQLTAAGVQFQRYPQIRQDELGIWTAPGGARVAWFQDPDGNLLSISQH